jgi:hypothetical protein
MQFIRLSPTPLYWLGGVLLVTSGAWHWLRSADAQSPAPAAAGQFELAYAQLYDKDLCETVIYHTSTGQSWQRFGITWRKIEEPMPLAAGRFQVKLIPSRQDGYRTFRLNQLTGQTWYIKDSKWAPYEALE